MHSRVQRASQWQASLNVRPVLGTQHLTQISVFVGVVVAGRGQATSLARMTPWLTAHTASDMKGGALSHAQVSLHIHSAHQSAAWAAGMCCLMEASIACVHEARLLPICFGGCCVSGG